MEYIYLFAFVGFYMYVFTDMIITHKKKKDAQQHFQKMKEGYKRQKVEVNKILTSYNFNQSAYSLTSSINSYWETTRRPILIRDHYKCTKCHKGKDETTLNVHHVIPLSEGGTNDESNLVTLCFSCHQEMHSHKLEEGVGVSKNYGKNAKGQKATTILKAINDQDSLFFRYKRLDGAESIRCVTPIKIFTQKGTAILIAHCHLRNTERNFSINRIADLVAINVRDLEVYERKSKDL